jgi:EAL domain-containing protein (putative c-di-GMP-specific phosphodiesterase class I)
MYNADAAMYRAKERGKNTYEFFDDSIGQAVKHRLDLKQQLRHALERDEFEIYYQPQFALEKPSTDQVLTTPRLLGFEALLRWRHPKLGLILPLSFIPAAEESGIILKIGTWVIERACEQLRIWHAAGFHDLQVAVNVSALQFGRAEFLDVLTSALKANDLKPSCLGLELTESVIMGNVAEVERQLIRVRRLGVDFVIDDFGTGYSSLSYLQKLPITHLKIDGSFVHSTHPGQTDNALLESIITLAHSLDLRVIAEGVEHPEELRLLQRLDCDSAQGNFLAQPMNAKNVTLFLQNQYS